MAAADCHLPRHFEYEVHIRLQWLLLNFSSCKLFTSKSLWCASKVVSRFKEHNSNVKQKGIEGIHLIISKYICGIMYTTYESFTNVYVYNEFKLSLKPYETCGTWRYLSIVLQLSERLRHLPPRYNACTFPPPTQCAASRAGTQSLNQAWDLYGSGQWILLIFRTPQGSSEWDPEVTIERELCNRHSFQGLPQREIVLKPQLWNTDKRLQGVLILVFTHKYFIPLPPKTSSCNTHGETDTSHDLIDVMHSRRIGLCCACFSSLFSVIHWPGLATLRLSAACDSTPIAPRFSYQHPGS